MRTSRSVAPDSVWPLGLQPTGLLRPWDSPGRNTGVGGHCLLQGVFLTQGSSRHLLCLLHWRADSSPPHHGKAPHCSSRTKDGSKGQWGLRLLTMSLFLALVLVNVVPAWVHLLSIKRFFRGVNKHWETRTANVGGFVVWVCQFLWYLLFFWGDFVSYYFCLSIDLWRMDLVQGWRH